VSAEPPWFEVQRGAAPLLVSIPHTGTDVPADIEARLASPWLARKDTDWHIERLYDFAADLGATIVRTTISRTVVDVNRDPSGASLYPGQATTGLCPTETFDGEPLYRPGEAPREEEIAARRAAWSDPYHAALSAEIGRLSTAHARVVLYDCHSIRSIVPRLFEGELPEFNIGTNGGTSADPALTEAIAGLCAGTGLSTAVNGRFKGGWITRFYGRPEAGVHAVQMELACRAYLDEPLGRVGPDDWPPPYDPVYAAPVRETLRSILQACLAFGRASLKGRP
jgi:N-formylglutamate deformylase